jgi:hypothetical protein
LLPLDRGLWYLDVFHFFRFCLRVKLLRG